MSRIYVCSPLRGADGQPSPANVKLAQRLMRAVFDAGHAPFVPHLLYPQVLSESPDDLKVSFAANFAWLGVAHEIWAFARKFEECSKGMKLEVTMPGLVTWRPKVVWMPPAFEAIAKEMGR